MLELAAKAAGFVELRFDPDGQPRARNSSGVAGPWNPLDDDGDALRLVIKLGLCIVVVEENDSVGVGPSIFDITVIEAMDDFGVRRAIVRAAAELGKPKLPCWGCDGAGEWNGAPCAVCKP